MSLNRWRLYSDHIALWKATFPVPPEHRVLLNVVGCLLEAASATEVAVFAKPDGQLWRSEDLIREIESRLEQKQTLDFFEFAGGHMRVCSKVAYWDGTSIAENVVKDLKELSIAVGVDATDHWLPQHGCEPLRVYGLRLEYGPQAKTMRSDSIGSITLKIDTTSDIWLPWVPWFTDDQFFDHHEVAVRNAARLNRFLASVRRIAIESGGDFEFSNMHGEGWIDAMAGPEGIKLIDEPPAR